MNDLEHLKATRELLAEPDHWTQGGYAAVKPHRTQDGPALIAETVSLDNPEAVCFCIHGAFAKASNATSFSAYSHVPLNRLLNDCLPPEYQNALDPDWNSSLQFNDEPGRLHSEVIAVLDCAISRLEGETK